MEFKEIKPVTLISSDISNGNQNVVLLEYFKMAGRNWKLEICSNAYKFQCFAQVYAQDPASLKWNVVAHIPAPNMKTPEGLCYFPAFQGKGMVNNRSWFVEDRTKLLDIINALC